MKKNGGKTYNEIPNRTRCRDTLNKRIINPFFLYIQKGERGSWELQRRNVFRLLARCLFLIC